MKHSIYSAVFTAPNCFRTVLRDTGISRFYSVCVKDIYNLEEVGRTSACGSSRENMHYDSSFTRVWSVVDRDLTYWQRPYKNVRYQEFHRRGRYIIIECFTLYRGVYNMNDLLASDKHGIKDLLYSILLFHPKIK
jgi:hypothetical protein